MNATMTVYLDSGSEVSVGASYHAMMIVKIIMTESQKIKCMVSLMIARITGLVIQDGDKNIDKLI